MIALQNGIVEESWGVSLGPRQPSSIPSTNGSAAGTTLELQPESAADASPTPFGGQRQRPAAKTRRLWDGAAAGMLSSHDAASSKPTQVSRDGGSAPNRER